MGRAKEDRVLQIFVSRAERDPCVDTRGQVLEFKVCLGKGYFPNPTTTPRTFLCFFWDDPQI
jgi:hypothetical protein